MASSCPSTDASQRRTFRTISSWVSPSKLKAGTRSGYRRPMAGDDDQVTAPQHMTPDEFRRHGHAVVDWLADYQQRVAGLPVLSTTAPGDTRAPLPPAPPPAPQPVGAVL